MNVDGWLIALRRRDDSIGTCRAGFKTVGTPGQDIFRGDVSCQTHFAGGWGGGGGGGSEAPFAVHVSSLPCPKSGPDRKRAVRTVNTRRTPRPLTRELDEGHAPDDAPDPADDDEEGQHLEEGGSKIEAEVAAGTTVTSGATTAHGERGDEGTCRTEQTVNDERRVPVEQSTRWTRRGGIFQTELTVKWGYLWNRLHGEQRQGAC